MVIGAGQKLIAMKMTQLISEFAIALAVTKLAQIKLLNFLDGVMRPKSA
jgi:hypothetical protein